MKRYWESGFGIVFIRERPYERWQWILNLVVCGVRGVLMRSWGVWGEAMEEY